MYEAKGSRALLSGARTVALVVAATGALIAAGVAQKPLFTGDSVLEIRLEAPFSRMLRSNDGGRHEGTLQLAAGTPIQLAISARGKSRLEYGICSFPGLMLHFDSGAVAGTLLAGQSALPLTAHCKDRSDYEQYVLLEYLVYRTYEIMSEVSLKSRLAHVEYFDSERSKVLTKRYGFFVEHWDDLAARHGWTRVRAPSVPPWEYDDADRNRFEMFQYLIGNTDWSYISAPPDEDFCCHNAVPIGLPSGPVFPVPFDFDQAGLVNAAYARPSATLPIRSVRQRLYRGVCLPRETLDSTLAFFRSEGPAIRELVEHTEGLTERSRRDALRYLDAFYETIGNARAVEREFVKGCRGEPG